MLPCRRGQVLLSTVNEQTMVPFISSQLQNLDLALALAKRGNLAGAEQLVVANFERQFQLGQFKEAAEAAADSPQVGIAMYWPVLCVIWTYASWAYRGKMYVFAAT